MGGVNDALLMKKLVPFYDDHGMVRSVQHRERRTTHEVEVQVDGFVYATNDWLAGLHTNMSRGSVGHGAMAVHTTGIDASGWRSVSTRGFVETGGSMEAGSATGAPS